MTRYRFLHPIEIRYGDIDAQRHVNNAQYFTYMEQARARYLTQLGLWDGRDFESIGIILAEQRCQYITPIILDQRIQVGVRTTRLGTKSIETEYTIRDLETNEELAIGHATLVAYDYENGRSVPVPIEWRNAISAYEDLAAA